jgi:PAS domain S-box-containing protein
MHVIFAEDEDMIRDTVSSFLKRMIFPNLHEVSDGLEAINKYKELYDQGIVVDFIITDITMPFKDGFELIEEAREFNEDLFALIISGLDFGPYFKKINAVSVRTQYLNKPVDLISLINKLQEMIKKIEKQKELKFSQLLAKQYKTAIDKSATVSKTDINGNITYVNDKFIEITGYSEKELLGKTHSLIKSPLVEDFVYKEMWETILEKKIYVYKNLPNVSKDGSTYYLNITIVPILDLNGEIIEFLSIKFDNTAVIRSLEEEKKAKETQATFLANMSHEIRTPLNAIVGFTRILSESKLNNEDTEHINIINDNAHLLVKTIGEILDFSKIQSGKMEIEYLFFSPQKEFTSIKKLFSAVAKEKDINLVLNIDDKLNNILINSDIIKIKQVISNLLSNAIKFTKNNGKVEFGIYIEEIIDDELVLKFVVKDNGIGIEDSKLKDIFKPFIQENQSTTRKYGGTGLGLSICKEIIELLGSELNVITKKDFGSMFYFSLTLNFKTVKENQIEAVLNKTKEFVYKDANILIAEDVIINQKLLDALLKKVDINAHFVNNGIEAVEYFKDKYESLDLILLDINMPVLDGNQALKQINTLQKEYKTTVPVIALTANAVKGDKDKFLSAGFDNYISKPINYDLLLVNLNKYLPASKIFEKNDLPNKDNETIETEIDFNLEEIAKNINLPYDFYLKLLKDFIQSIDSEIEILNKQLKENKVDDFRSQAHKLMGLCGNLGFNNLFEIFKELEITSNKELSLILINKSISDIELIKNKLKD